MTGHLYHSVGTPCAFQFRPSWPPARCTAPIDYSAVWAPYASFEMIGISGDRRGTSNARLEPLGLSFNALMSPNQPRYPLTLFRHLGRPHRPWHPPPASNAWIVHTEVVPARLASVACPSRSVLALGTCEPPRGLLRRLASRSVQCIGRAWGRQ
jgi:hypothetical protein